MPFHVVGNRSGEKVEELLVGFLAMEPPDRCRQVADLFVPFVDQEAGCGVAGLLTVADALVLVYK